jgi:hypothetical protein
MLGEEGGRERGSGERSRRSSDVSFCDKGDRRRESSWGLYRGLRLGGGGRV